MQPAKLTGNGPGARIYRYLVAQDGRWVSNIELIRAEPCLALSTHVSAVRLRLTQEPWHGEVCPEACVIDGVHHYRIERVGQTELAFTA